MQSPLKRIRLGAFVLGTILLVAVIGYRVLGDYSWIDSLWMVVITISSVGYGERSQSEPIVQLFTIAVIILGMSAAVYTFGGFIQFVLEGELEKLLGYRRMTREIERITDHVIICGFGRIGEVLSADLQRQKRPFLIIDNDADRIEAAKSHGHLCLAGDATEEEVLQLVGVTVQETEAHRHHRLLVVAVKQADDKIIFNPDPTHAFHPGDILMLMGQREDIRLFREEYDV